MKIYYFALSDPSRLVCAVARHLGVQHEVEHVDLPSMEQRKPAHVARNPNGKVPVM
jgi:glutathione S-transferase